jgi:hypothetical protein
MVKHQTGQDTEIRRVEVTDAGLSPVTRRELADDIREVIGSDMAQVPIDQEHPSRGARPRSSTLLATLHSDQFLLQNIGAWLVVVAAVAGIALTHSWLMLALALVALLAFTGWIAMIGSKLMAIPERPHPATDAALEEDGVRDPEEHFSRLVEEFAGAEVYAGR